MQTIPEYGMHYRFLHMLTKILTSPLIRSYQYVDSCKSSGKWQVFSTCQVSIYTKWLVSKDKVFTVWLSWKNILLKAQVLIVVYQHCESRLSAQLYRKRMCSKEVLCFHSPFIWSTVVGEEDTLDILKLQSPKVQTKVSTNKMIYTEYIHVS